MATKTAAIIVVGNEILSGKVVDSNSSYAARELRAVGVSVERIIVIPDDVEIIADVIRDCRRRYDLLFTSGGVGPTHDDVTVAGIARGLGVAVVHHPILIEAIRQFGELTPSRLKMAEVPDGAEAIFSGSMRFPTVQFENIFILPGIPEIFREKMAALAPQFTDAPYHLRVVYVQVIESAIAPQLNNTLSAFPRLLLGSYPKLDDPEYRVRVTFESKDRDYADRALDHLLAQLPAAMIVKVE